MKLAFSTSVIFALMLSTVSARLGAHPKLRQLGADEEALPDEYVIQLSDTVEDAGSMLDSILFDHDDEKSSKVHSVYNHALKGGTVKLHKTILTRVLDDPRVESVDPVSSSWVYIQSVSHSDFVSPQCLIYHLNRISLCTWMPRA